MSVDNIPRYEQHSFDRDLNAIFTGLENDHQSMLFSKLFDSKSQNAMTELLANHFKKIYDNAMNQKKWSRAVTISTYLTPIQQQRLSTDNPEFQLSFSNTNRNAHAYANASRIIELHNILYCRIRYGQIVEAPFEAVLRANKWDVLIKDVGGDPIISSRYNLRSIHACSPTINSNSYDSIRQTTRITNILFSSKHDPDAETLLHSIGGSSVQSARCCSSKGQDCSITAPFVMFIHSLYDMSLLDIADTMDRANALVGYASLIYDDRIMIHQSGTLQDLGVWWEYTDPIVDHQWSPEEILFHTSGCIRFGFVDDDGLNYVHDLAKYKALFTNQRIYSSNNIAFNIQLLDNRSGIQYLTITREHSASAAGVDHTLNLKSLEDHYLVSYYELANDNRVVKPTSPHTGSDPSWELPPRPHLRPVRFPVLREPVDDTVKFLCSVRDGLKPAEVLNFLRTNAATQIVNSTIVKKKLKLSEGEFAALARAIYLRVFSSNWMHGKIVQQGIADIEANRSFIFSRSWFFNRSADYLSLHHGFMTRFAKRFTNVIRAAFALTPLAVVGCLWYRLPQFTGSTFVGTASIAFCGYFACTRFPTKYHHINPDAFIVIPKTRYTFPGIPRQVSSGGLPYTAVSEPTDGDRFAKTVIHEIFDKDTISVDDVRPNSDSTLWSTISKMPSTTYNRLRSSPAVPAEHTDRATFKFEHLKTHLKPSYTRAIDLSAAPGGWLLPLSHLAVSVDYMHYSDGLPMKYNLDIGNRLPHTGSIETLDPSSLDTDYDLVVSDIGLAGDCKEESLLPILPYILRSLLRCTTAGGDAVVKVYRLQSNCTISTLLLFLQHFEDYHICANPNSRSTSTEFYLILRGRLNTPSIKSRTALIANIDAALVRKSERLSDHQQSVVTVETPVEPEQPSQHTVIPTLGDGDCCFRAANFNATIDYTALKRRLLSILPKSPDLTQELSGTWGGSAFLDAYGKFMNITYCVHAVDNVYWFGDTSRTRCVHLKYSGVHYDLLSDHTGTLVAPSYPVVPYNRETIIKHLRPFLSVHGHSIPNHYYIADNLLHLCYSHSECSNSSIAAVFKNHVNTSAIFLVHKPTVDVPALNALVSGVALGFVVHAIPHPDYYFLSLKDGAQPLTDEFTVVDEHHARCTCVFKSVARVGSIVYYCQVPVDEFVPYSGQPVDLTFILHTSDRKVGDVPDVSRDGTTIHAYVPVDETLRHKRSHVLDTFDEFVSQTRTKCVSSILVDSYFIDPQPYLSAITRTYPDLATKYIQNSSGGGFRDTFTPLLETSQRNIHINSMEERRHIWRNSVSFVIDTLQDTHAKNMIAYFSGNDLSSLNATYCLYDAQANKYLYGKPVNARDVNWAWDGTRLINFEGLEKAHTQTSSRFISFNEHSMLIPHFYHYKRVRAIDLEDYHPNVRIHDIQGAPGCGKTEYILNTNSKVKNTLLITVSRAAKVDMCKRIEAKAAAGKFDTKGVTVATFDSFMIHSRDERYNTVWFDEALLAHGGDWLWIAYLTRCRDLYIVGDKAQIPYCDRTQFKSKYAKPSIEYHDTKYLTRTFRCPRDITHWLNVTRSATGQRLYTESLTSNSTVLHSAYRQLITGVASVPRDPKAQYLVFTKSEAADLANHFGDAIPKDNIKTIHQYQGNQTFRVIIVRLVKKDANPIYKRINWILVALTRHTHNVGYYTTNADDMWDHIGRICNYTDSEIRLAGGHCRTFDTKHKEIEVTLSRTQQPWTFPRLTQRIIDRYGAAYFIPAMFHSRYKRPIVDVEYQKLIPDQLSHPRIFLQHFHDSILGPADEVRYDHHTFALGDKRFYGDFSQIQKIEVIKPKPYCEPFLRTAMRPRTPDMQPQLIKAFIERNGAVPKLSDDIDATAVGAHLFETLESLLDPELMMYYRDNPITVNAQSITNWLHRQPTSVHRILEDDTFHLLDHNPSKYSYSMKSSPKPDLEHNPSSRYKSAQTICYQHKLFNAMFCPVFKDVTDRLLAALPDNIILYNRMSPRDFVNAVNRVFPFRKFMRSNKFIEFDFSKYDKSHDLISLWLQVLAMIRMGVPLYLIALWILMNIFALVVNGVMLFRAVLIYQRKSGDGGTWLFNTLLSLLVIVFTLNLTQSIKNGHTLVAAGGDDTLVATDEVLVSTDHMSHTCASLLNLEVKILRHSHPYFCSKHFIPTERGVLFVPDVLKAVTKLGRRDIVNRAHAEEYYVSFSDNFADLADANYWPQISDAINDRYKTQGDHVGVLRALYTLSVNRDQFLSMWDYSTSVDVPILPSLDI